MISLKCDSCGGQLKRDEGQFFVSENVVIVKAGCGFECQHCGNEFLPGTQHEAQGSNTQIAIGENIAQASGGGIAIVQRAGHGAVQIGSVTATRGGIAVGGNVGGDVVVGNKHIIIDRR